ncbi:MAG: hypothetical protein WA172_12140 [Terriglobales bacterium]
MTGGTAGGIVSTFGAVLALYSAATRSDEWKGIAWQAINYALYGGNDDGCPYLLNKPWSVT